jgi:hypothetical protein
MSGLNGTASGTTPEYPTNAKGQRICGARLTGKRRGQLCESRVVMENGRCRLHGGKSVRGIAHPNYKGGRYSKYMPARLMDAAQAASLDPELLSLREEIGLVYARLADILERVDTGESGAMWLNVSRCFDEFMSVRGNAGEFLALARLREAVEAGKTDYMAWHEIGNLIEVRRKLVETEHKRLVAMEQMITSERALLLMAAFVNIIKAHVNDPRVLSAISTDVGKLLNHGSPATVDGDGGA